MTRLYIWCCWVTFLASESGFASSTAADKALDYISNISHVSAITNAPPEQTYPWPSLSTRLNSTDHLSQLPPPPTSFHNHSNPSLPFQYFKALLASPNTSILMVFSSCRPCLICPFISSLLTNQEHKGPSKWSSDSLAPFQVQCIAFGVHNVSFCTMEKPNMGWVTTLCSICVQFTRAMLNLCVSSHSHSDQSVASCCTRTKTHLQNYISSSAWAHCSLNITFYNVRKPNSSAPELSILQVIHLWYWLSSFPHGQSDMLGIYYSPTFCTLLCTLTL